LLRRRSAGKRGGKLRLLFATDLHGADIVFRKFLNAATVYEADVAILGGDLTGKRILPIIQRDGRYQAEVMGQVHTAADEKGLAKLRGRVHDLGEYPIVVSEDELAILQAQPKLIEERFEAECHAQVTDWMRRAAERLEPLEVPLHVTGGNDDYLSIETILDQAEWITNAEGQVIPLRDGLEMISTGYGNPTPWHCPRDISEDELAQRIEAMASRLEEPHLAVFNLHVPPFGSGLDYCPKLDTSQDPPRPIVGEEIAAGSTAVSETIRRYQPLLSLHGHIHESPGIRRLGRTVSINPGSEYAEGVLRCAVVDIEGDRVSPQLLTA
jgi:Icc-related predicted phosphoesterase